MQVNPDIKVIHHTIDASRSPHSACCAFCQTVCTRDKESVCLCVWLEARRLIQLHNRLFSMPHQPSIPPPLHPLCLSCLKPNIIIIIIKKTACHCCCHCHCLLIDRGCEYFPLISVLLYRAIDRPRQHASTNMNTDRKADRWLFKTSWNAKERKTISPRRFDRSDAHFIWS